jgi:hypothetical protein
MVPETSRRCGCRRSLVFVPLCLGACAPALPSADLPESASPWFSLAAGDATVLRRVGVVPVWTAKSGAERSGFSELIGATKLSDGTFVVADHRAGSLHYVSSDGGPLRVVGGTGSGPGEFRSLDGIGISGRDTVWAYDQSLRRVTFFDKTGAVLETRVLGITGRPSWPSVVGVVSGGRAIVLERNLPLPIGQPAGAVWRDSTRLLWYSLTVQSHTVTRDVPLFDTYVDAAGPTAGIVFLPFTPRLSAMVSPADGQVHVGYSERFRVMRYSESGDSAGVVERAFVGREVTDEDVRRQEAKGIPRNAIPRRMPAFGQVIADWSGGFWVQEYEPGGYGLRWASFDARGRLQALVILPPMFRLLLVDGKDLLGAQEDPDGVPVVAFHRIPEG